jgi:salicylate hydroxylase
MATRPVTVIVGAGVGGLSLALTLQKQRFPFLLIDKYPVSALCSDIGGGYEMAPNAVKRLQEFGLEEQLKIQGVNNNHGCVYRENGTLIRQFHDIPGAFYSIGRGALQRMMLDALGPENVLTGEIESITPGGEQFTVQLKDGRSLEGHLLVGADGTHSYVRSTYFGRKAEYAGSVCAWGKLSPAVASQIVKNPGYCVIFGSNTSLAGGRSAAHYIWSVFAKQPSSHWGDGKPKQMVMERFSHYPDWVKKLMEATAEEDVSLTAIWDTLGTAQEPWTTTSPFPVALIGDAAHVMTPFLGQGANTAMGDGSLLGKLLIGNWTDASIPSSQLKHVLEQYETIATKSALPFMRETRKSMIVKNVRGARKMHDQSLLENLDSWIVQSAFFAARHLLPESVVASTAGKADKPNDLDLFLQ